MNSLHDAKIGPAGQNWICRCSCGWRSLETSLMMAAEARDRHVTDSMPKPLKSWERKNPDDVFRLWEPYVCPECRRESLFGYYFADEEGRHQSTHYVCTFWSSVPGAQRCGWHGWTVPEGGK